MFDSLDEQIRKDEDKSSTSQQRMMRYGLIALVGVLVCCAVIAGIHFMS
jgi:hypothetical protein